MFYLLYAAHAHVRLFVANKDYCSCNVMTSSKIYPTRDPISPINGRPLPRQVPYRLQPEIKERQQNVPAARKARRCGTMQSTSSDDHPRHILSNRGQLVGDRSRAVNSPALGE